MEKMGELECYGVFPEENVIQVPHLPSLLSLRLKRGSDWLEIRVFRCTKCLECTGLKAEVPFYQLGPTMTC